MIAVILAAQFASLPIPEGCERIRDGAHNSECADRALQEADGKLDELRAKIRLVGDRFSTMSLDGGGGDPSINPRTKMREMFDTADLQWRAYRKAECAAQNVTLEEGYEDFVAYKNCLTLHAHMRIASLEAAFGPYIIFLESPE